MTDFAKLAAAMEKVAGVNDENHGVQGWLDSGFLPLNHAISGEYRGGFPYARIVEIFGPESCGKTWLATQLMIACQKAGGVAGFHDHERSFIFDVGERLGLDTSPGRFFFKKPDTFEQSITLFIKATTAIREAKIIPDTAPLVWVFDSLAQMVPAAKLAKDVTDLNMNDTTMLSRVCSAILPAVAQIAERNNVMVVILNQIRQKPGVAYGSPDYAPGGKTRDHSCSVRIQLGASRLMKDEGGEKTMIGQEVKAVVIKNKVSRPYMVAKWKFLFGDDGVGRFAVAESMIDFAVAKKLLAVAGARVVWTDGTTLFKSVLAKKLETEGKVGELEALIVASGVKPDEEIIAPTDGEEVAA
jgi:recombination protein RecA